MRKALVVVAVLLLSGCTVTPQPTPTPTSTAVEGWPNAMIPLVDEPLSAEVEEYCPFPWTPLVGSAISQTIPADDWASLDVTSCAFSYTLPEPSVDTLDELAFHVDSGAPELIEAYVASDGEPDPECADVTEMSNYAAPILSVEYDGERFGLMSGTAWCLETQTASQQLLADLVLTQLVRETVPFEPGG